MNSNTGFLIAVATTDGINIFPRMLGRAKYFYIYSTDGNGNFDLIDKRINPYENTLQHLKTEDIYSVIKDCKIIISALIGKKGIERLQKKGVKLVYRKGNINDALKTVFTQE